MQRGVKAHSAQTFSNFDGTISKTNVICLLSNCPDATQNRGWDEEGVRVQFVVSDVLTPAGYAWPR